MAGNKVLGLSAVAEVPQLWMFAENGFCTRKAWELLMALDWLGVVAIWKVVLVNVFCWLEVLDVIELRKAKMCSLAVLCDAFKQKENECVGTALARSGWYMLHNYNPGGLSSVGCACFWACNPQRHWQWKWAIALHSSRLRSSQVH